MLELGARLGLKWLDAKPFSVESKARRKAKRAAKRKARKGEPLTDDEVILMEPTLRTSTKAGGAAGAGTIVLAVIGVFFPDFVSTLTPDQALWIGGVVTAVIGWVTARFSRTAKNPGVL